MKKINMIKPFSDSEVGHTNQLVWNILGAKENPSKLSLLYIFKFKLDVDLCRNLLGGVYAKYKISI